MYVVVNSFTLIMILPRLRDQRSKLEVLRLPHDQAYPRLNDFLVLLNVILGELLLMVSCSHLQGKFTPSDVELLKRKVTYICTCTCEEDFQVLGSRQL
jgi:hypothetical protein